MGLSLAMAALASGCISPSARAFDLGSARAPGEPQPPPEEPSPFRPESAPPDLADKAKYVGWPMPAWKRGMLGEQQLANAVTVPVHGGGKVKLAWDANGLFGRFWVVHRMPGWRSKGAEQDHLDRDQPLCVVTESTSASCAFHFSLKGDCIGHVMIRGDRLTDAVKSYGWGEAGKTWHGDFVDFWIGWEALGVERPGREPFSVRAYRMPPLRTAHWLYLGPQQTL